MSRFTSHFLLVLLALLATPLIARADSIDDYIKTAMQKRRIPGLALAVVKDGVVVKAEGYGVANLETDAPVTPQSVFELASVTKQFTATAIMLLVEDGRIGLDDRISRHLDRTPDSWKNITVRHLLTHTSGLPPLGKDFRSLVWTLRVSTDAMYEAARRDPISFPPGEQYQYSDVGYFLLGLIIERTSGRKYAEFLNERIFRPVGMTDTSVLNQLTIIKNRVRGYTLLNNQVVNIRRDYQVELPSHFGIMSTVIDLARWDAALRSDKLLKPASLAMMWTPVKSNNGKLHGYGFGWELGEQRGHRIVGHTGITGTEITRFPDDGLTVIVLTNLGRWGGSETSAVNSWGITTRVATFYLNDLAYQPIIDSDPGFTALIKDLYVRRVEFNWDKSLFTPDFWSESQSAFKANTGYFRSLGPLKSIALVEHKLDPDQRTDRFRLSYAERSLILSVRRNASGKIHGLSVNEEAPE